MAKAHKSGLEETKRIMAALVRMPPKPHEEMKGKSKQAATAKRPRKENPSK